MSYFDYEKISDHLPSEGEAIIVSRKDGELDVRPCPYLPEDLVSDNESMGVLLIANEKLSRIGGLSFFVCFAGTLIACGNLWQLMGWGLSFWWLYLAISIALFGLHAGWISNREAWIFRHQVEPRLRDVQRKQKLSAPALLSVLKQIPELQSLATEYQEHLAEVVWKEPAIAP